MLKMAQNHGFSAKGPFACSTLLQNALPTREKNGLEHGAPCRENGPDPAGEKGRGRAENGRAGAGDAIRGPKWRVECSTLLQNALPTREKTASEQGRNGFLEITPDFHRKGGSEAGRTARLRAGFRPFWGLEMRLFLPQNECSTLLQNTLLTREKNGLEHGARSWRKRPEMTLPERSGRIGRAAGRRGDCSQKALGIARRVFYPVAKRCCYQRENGARTRKKRR